VCGKSAPSCLGFANVKDEVGMDKVVPAPVHADGLRATQGAALKKQPFLWCPQTCKPWHTHTLLPPPMTTHKLPTLPRALPPSPRRVVLLRGKSALAPAGLNLTHASILFMLADPWFWTSFYNRLTLLTLTALCSVRQARPPHTPTLASGFEPLPLCLTRNARFNSCKR